MTERVALVDLLNRRRVPLASLLAGSVSPDALRGGAAPAGLLSDPGQGPAGLPTPQINTQPLTPAGLGLLAPSPEIDARPLTPDAQGLLAPSLVGSEYLGAISADDPRLSPMQQGMLRAWAEDPNPERTAAVEPMIRDTIGDQITPDPFRAQSWWSRNVANPLTQGVANLQQAAGAGLAGSRSELLTTFDELDRIAAEQGTQAAMNRAAELGMPTAIEYGRALVANRPDVLDRLRNDAGTVLGAGVSDVLAGQETVAGIPQDPALGAALESGDVGQLAGAILDDPGIILRVGAQSLPTMAPGLLLSPAIGPAAGMGLGSLAVESNLSLLQALQEAGAEMTPEGLRAAFADPEIMARARDFALARGVPIALLDALAGGIAGRAVSSSGLGNMAAQMGTQAGLGAGGEALAQVSSGQDLNLAEVGLEGVAEFVTAPVEVATALASNRGQQGGQGGGGADQSGGRPIIDAGGTPSPVVARQVAATYRPGMPVLIEDYDSQGNAFNRAGVVERIDGDRLRVRTDDGRLISAGAFMVRPMDADQAAGALSFTGQPGEPPATGLLDDPAEWEPLFDTADDGSDIEGAPQVGWINTITQPLGVIGVESLTLGETGTAHFHSSYQQAAMY